MDSEPAVDIPPSLLRFEAPVFLGVDLPEGPSGPTAKPSELNQGQLDEMLNAMLPPREVRARGLCEVCPKGALTVWFRRLAVERRLGNLEAAYIQGCRDAA
eukprot:scaffold870_cov268-Pinguiococcus_pyrenoidosus.AAC.91